jgi:hypothetical protein
VRFTLLLEHNINVSDTPNSYGTTIVAAASHAIAISGHIMGDITLLN